MQENKRFFYFTIIQNEQVFGLKKKQLFFLVLEVEKLNTFLQKKCEHQIFMTPTHQVIIVITNFNIFEDPPTPV